MIKLFDPTTGNALMFYDEQFLISGVYDFGRKYTDQEYDYTFDLELVKRGGYYNYCIEKDIPFLEDIMFYGYQQ